MLLCAADNRAQFKTVEYTDTEYESELQHIEEVRVWAWEGFSRFADNACHKNEAA